MFEIKDLENIESKESKYNKLSSFVYKLGGTLELLIILLVWILIFREQTMFGGYTEKEIITYLIGGSIIGLFTGFLMQRLIAADLKSKDSKLMVYKPVKYFFHILLNGWGKIIMPFAIAVCFHLLVLVTFKSSFEVNHNPAILALIGLMIILNFVIEFLIAYLLKIYVFWTIESHNFYQVLERLKRFFAGNYFPLSFLPVMFFKALLLMPFAYAFFVPAELYLNKMTFSDGLIGIFIQLFWIFFIYILIRISWQKKVKNKI